MDLSKARLDKYDKDIAAIQKAAKESFLQIYKAKLAQYGSPDVATKRNVAIETMQEVISQYGDASSVVAQELVNDILGTDAKGKTDDVFADMDDEQIERLDRFVHGRARHLVNGDDTEFENQCSEYVSTETHENANRAMRKIAKKNGLRYARVPMGGETCEFCIMLASRGFVYTSADNAGEGTHYHTHCRCKIIPGKKGSTVEGYDPNSLYKQWKDSERSRQLTTEIKSATVPTGPVDRKISTLKSRIEKQKARGLDVGQLQKELAEAESHLREIQYKNAAAMRRIIGKRRELAAVEPSQLEELLPKNVSQGDISAIISGLSYLPKEWVDTILAGKPRYTKVRGDLGGRASFTAGLLNVLDGDVDALTMLHEHMHALEFFDEKYSKLSHEFLSKECAGAPVSLLRSITGDINYSKTEKAYDMGKKETAYAYKIYPDKSTEVLSYGLELFYRNPQELAKIDRELFNHISHVLLSE